jgi:hypothetical protein
MRRRRAKQKFNKNKSADGTREMSSGGDAGGEPPPSKKWGHPFTPYPIQEEFMREAYDVLSTGGIGVFESPTGTGARLPLADVA